MNLEHKTILLTGATGGIGRALTKVLIEQGANLILVARNTRLLKVESKKIQALHPTLNITTFTCDLTNSTDRKRLVSKLRRRYPTIDCLINCAGIGIYKPFAKVTEKDWSESFALNVTAPYFLTQSLLPFLRTSKLSLVINIGSCSALHTLPERSVYNSTKAALRTATLCLNKEFTSSKPTFVHITLDSTLTSFGPLTIADKKREQQDGKLYLSPDWVAGEIRDIMRCNNPEAEYVLSPDCYTDCGICHKP